MLLLDSLWSVNTLGRLVGLQIAQIYGPDCAFKRDLTIRKVKVQRRRLTIWQFNKRKRGHQ